VPVEQLGEAGRLHQRRGDHLRVVRRGLLVAGAVTQSIAEPARRVPQRTRASFLVEPTLAADFGGLFIDVSVSG
jgi:hypothetical protein